MSFIKEWAKFKYEVCQKNVKLNQVERPINWEYGQSLSTLIAGLNTGSIRRKLMMEWFKQLAPVEGYMRLPVGCKWCWSMNDVDLKRLLKEGKVKLVRDNHGSRKMNPNDRSKPRGAFRSYLTLNVDKQ